MSESEETTWQRILEDKGATAAARLDALEKLGDAFHKAQKYTEAIPLMEEALQERPNLSRMSRLAEAYGNLPKPDYERQIELLIKACRQKPHWGDYHNASIAAEKLGDIERAIALEIFAWKSEPVVKAGTRMMKLLRANGKNEAAEVFARDLVKRLGEDNEYAWSQVISTLNANNKIAEALEAARKAESKLPTKFTNDLCFMLDRRARELDDKEQKQAGWELIEEMIKLAPTPLNHLKAANFALNRLKDELIALQHYQRCLELAPNDPYAKANLGTLLYRRADVAGGVEYLKEAFEALPTNSWIAFQYANCLLETRRAAEAERVSFLAIEKTADPTDSLHILGHVYHDFGLFDNAIAAFQAALACRPELSKLYQDLMAVELERGKLDAARKHIQDGLEKHPNCLACQSGEIEVALASGDIETAKTLVDTAAKRTPKDARFRLLAGRCFLAAGDLDAAQRAFEEVVEKNPYDDSAWFLLGTVFTQKRLPDAAIDPLREAIFRNPNNKLDRFDALLAVLRVTSNAIAEAEIAREREKVATDLAAGKAELRGFSAVPKWKPPIKQTPAATPEPMSAERSDGALEDAILLLEEINVDAVFRAFLEYVEPSLNIAEMLRRTNDIVALDPTSWGPHTRPFRARMRGLRWGEKLVEELEQDTKSLRQAGKKLFGKSPALFPKQIACEIEPLRQLMLFIGHEPSSYTIVDFADCEHQFDEFADEIGRLGQHRHAVWLRGWSNQLKSFPFDELDLPNLRYVQLSSNKFQKIPPALTKCGSMEVLDLWRNPIEEIPEDLSGLKNLRYLDLAGSRLSAEQFAELRAALPNCYIRQHEQGPNHHRFELVAAYPEGVIGEKDVVIFNPKDPLPAVGTYTMAATANLDGERDVPCVMFYHAPTHGGQVWRRDATGLWRDRTPDVQNLKPAFKVAAK